MQYLILDSSIPLPPTRDYPGPVLPASMQEAKEVKVHPTISGSENASLYFVGTATTILDWAGIRLMTDPNFLYEIPSFDKKDYLHFIHTRYQFIYI